MNAADDATRLSHPTSFDPECRWIRGPARLREDEDSCPHQPEFQMEERTFA